MLQKTLVEHAVAERKNWAKFGAEKGNKAGPDRTTTTVGEEVFLKLAGGNKATEPEQSSEQILKSNLAKAGKVVCRLCKGDHFTAKCPYKDTLGGLDGEFLILMNERRLTNYFCRQSVRGECTSARSFCWCIRRCLKYWRQICTPFHACWRRRSRRIHVSGRFARGAPDLTSHECF